MEDQQGSTKFIDPRLQEVQATTTNLYNKAIEEFGFKMPLAFALYNQIRYYEDFGKLKIGYSIQGKEALANQFGVTVKQIERAYNNLTSKYKLGSWVVSDTPIFRNVKKVWVSNVRQQRMSVEDTLELAKNYYSVVENDQKLLRRSSKTTTAEYFSTGVAPLSESNKKVIYNINNTSSIEQKTVDEELINKFNRIALMLGETLTREQLINLLQKLPIKVTPDQLRYAAEDYRDGNWSNKSLSNFLSYNVFMKCISPYLPFKGKGVEE